ncbi:MAG: stage III sporulation protein AE [Clostridia bacterium]|nr:stage III sporulation protein AE [Clostridia bacterium]
MKRKIITIVTVVLCLIYFSFFFSSVSTVKATAETNEGTNGLNESIVELLDELDLQALEEYVDSLDSFSDKSVSERLFEYIKGDSIDYPNFFSGMADVLFENVKTLLPSFLCIAAVTLLCGIVTTLKVGKTAASSESMIFLIAYASSLIPVLAVVTECFTAAKESVSAMQTQMQIVFPLLLTLMAASGGTVSAAICRPAVAFFSTNIVTLISSVVFPLTLVIIAFSVAGHLSKELKFGKFAAFFKSVNKWIIGVSVSVFGLFFTLQGLTAATYDGITRRAAKYAIGTGVPIVGGFLSGGFDLAVAGSALIKNSLGSMSIFMMVSVLFEPIVLLVSVNLLLKLTAAITQPFGDERISDFLGETASNLNYCTAGVLFSAFLYFLCIVLIVGTSEAFF